MKRPRTLAVVSSAAATVLLFACTGTTRQQVKVVAPKTTTTTATTAAPPDCAASLPSSAKAGQMTMVIVTSTDLAAPLIASGQAGGFAIKGPQPKNIGALVAKATADAPVTPFVASEEEGGTVQRLASAIKTLPSAKEMAKGVNGVGGSPEAAGRAMGEYAASMKKLGFNMLLGPVADVGNGAGLGTRTFSDDPAVVSTYVTAIVKAVQDAGLIAVVKHWPGIGGAKDGPQSKPYSLSALDQLRQKDLAPFQAAIRDGVKGVMVGHGTVPGLTGPNEMTSLSQSAITGELRGTEGFKGLVITDSLGAGAVASSMSQSQAAEKAIAAGADIAMISGADSVPKVHSQLIDAIDSGRLDATKVTESVRRILAAKGVKGPCPDLVASMTRLDQTNGSQTSSPPGSTAADGQSPTTDGQTSASDGTAATGTSSPSKKAADATTATSAKASGGGSTPP